MEQEDAASAEYALRRKVKVQGGICSSQSGSGPVATASISRPDAFTGMLACVTFPQVTGSLKVAGIGGIF